MLLRFLWFLLDEVQKESLNVLLTKYIIYTVITSALLVCKLSFFDVIINVLFVCTAFKEPLNFIRRLRQQKLYIEY